MGKTSKSVWTAVQLAAIAIAFAGGFAVVRAKHVSSGPLVVKHSYSPDPETTSSLLKLRDAP